MAITFLAAVNSTLTDASIIQSDLASFTSTAHQVDVDVMLRSWNDAIDELYRFGNSPMRGETAISTFTLAADTSAYSLAADFVTMTGNPVGSTDNDVLKPYPGGFEQLRVDLPDRTDFAGAPTRWAINPTDGNLEIDATPTSSENGNIYTYEYEKDQDLAATGDTFPFNDEVVRALRDAVVQLFSRKRKASFDEGIYNVSMARAAHKLRNRAANRTYGPGRAQIRRS